MKLLVNCDQVFDVLTRGPFPTGEAGDEAVEQHLRACHDCRRLAEALRPAVALMHEAVGGDQALNLPEYQGSLPASPLEHDPYATTRKLSRDLRRLDARPQPAPKPAFDFPQLVNGLRLLAASVLVVALGTLAWGLLMSARTHGIAAGSPDRLDPRMMGVAAAARPDRDGLISLASLKLHGSCFPPQLTAAAEAGTLHAAMASEEALRCCTHCHAGGKSAGTVQVAANTRFSQTCTACHRG